MLGIIKIQEVLPHRYPMLLLDRILEISDDHVLAQKNVTVNEPHFQGHFQDYPIVPGTLLIESALQAAAFFGYKGSREPSTQPCTYRATSVNVKFLKEATPGEVLLINLDKIRASQNILSINLMISTSNSVRIARGSMTVVKIS